MNTYSVNIVTDTRPGDSFAEVAVNTFPVVFFGDSTEELFSDEVMEAFVRKNAKTENLHNKMRLCIREITEEGACIDTIVPVREKYNFKQQ